MLYNRGLYTFIRLNCISVILIISVVNVFNRYGVKLSIAIGRRHAVLLIQTFRNCLHTMYTTSKIVTSLTIYCIVSSKYFIFHPKVPSVNKRLNVLMVE